MPVKPEPSALPRQALSDLMIATQASLLRAPVPSLILRSGEDSETRRCEIDRGIARLTRIGARGTPHVGSVSRPELRGRSGDRVLNQVHQLDAGVIPAVAAANHGPVSTERAIGESEPWGKIVLIRIEKRFTVEIAERAIGPEVLVERFGC